MPRNNREGYEFEPEIKWEVRKAQHERCGWPGCNKHIETFHHILPIAVARKYYPHILPDLIASIDNCIGYCEMHHKKEHQQAHDYGQIARELVEAGKRVRA